MEPEFESIKEIEEYLKNLSNEDISDRLKAFNCKSGPVTKSTRILYLKRLKEIFVSSLKFLDDIEPSYEKVKNNYEQKNDNEWQKNDKKAEYKHSIMKAPKIETYFGVQVPSFHNKEGPFVFADKIEAVKFSKSYPGSRFKMFVDEEEARRFSAEVNFASVAFTKMRDGQRADESGDLIAPLFPSSLAPKESLPFSSIKCSEFVMFRKALENGDVEKAKELIWTNPRYLIGNGDNPTVLQEGCRYNALHVCCKSGQLQSCQLIMDTITDLNFYQILYRDELPEKRQARLDFLVDMYLNNREKGGMETPLHFACKFGFEEVVKYLLKFGVIEKNAKNGAGQTPFEVINSRAKEPNLVVKKRIENAFEDPYYVFIIRSEDNSELPQVSHPFCPNRPTISSLVPTNMKSRSFRKFFSSPIRMAHVNGIDSRTKSCAANSENGFPRKRIGSMPDRVHSGRAADKDDRASESNVESLAEFQKQCTEINKRWPESNGLLANENVDEKLKEEEEEEENVSNHSRDTISQGDACSSDGDCKSSNLFKLSHRGDCGTSARSSNNIEKTLKDLETSSSSSTDSKSNAPYQNGITNHAFDNFETPPRHSAHLPSTPSDLKSCFQTPRNLVNGKVSILCKTPTNKQLILLADAGLETSLTPYALAKGERFSTPEPMRQSNSRPTPSKSACKDTDNWEKILNTPIFTAKDIPKKIRGIAGPMPKNKCCDFREKVLLRDLDDEEYDDFNRIRRTDSNKGLERICRQIAKCMDVSWSEYWDFLGCDADLTSEEGLDLFEGHMKGIVEFSVSVCENVNVEKEAKTTEDDLLSNDFSKLCIKSPPVKVNKRLRWSDDDDDEFLDARTKLDDGEEFYELNSRYNNGMFIFGDLPTRSDLDAFRAVEPMGKHLKAYPFIYSWFTNVKSFSEAERSRWPDAACIGHVLSTGQSRRRDLFASIRKYDLVSSPNIARDLTPRFLEG